MQKLWIVTWESDDDNQYGEYFVAAFTNKPSKEELHKLLPLLTKKEIDWLYDGGGRKGSEASWYFLRERECGVDYSIGMV